MMSLAPKSDELEVSVFGPGIGECIVLHLGDGDWMVVDSCLDGPQGAPVAETYLESLGVDISTQIKLILATHWHDDHVKGIGSLLRKANSAAFAHPLVYELADIYDLVLNGARSGSASATLEYGQVLSVLSSRKKSGSTLVPYTPVFACANRRLLRLAGAGRSCDSEVVSLSPSDAVLDKAKSAIRVAIDSIRANKRPQRPTANEMSVASWIRVGHQLVMLGGDLENAAGPHEGWNAIVNSNERPEGVAGIFKLPHHGALSAHHAPSWDELLGNGPIAALTPYTRSRLPSGTDIERINMLTPEAYLTSSSNGGRPPNRDKAVERTTKEVGVSRRTLLGKVGHIQIRVPANNLDASPSVLLANGARALKREE